MRNNGRGNSYARSVGQLYEQAPKEVWAAIAVSYASAGGDLVGLSCVTATLLDEWRILHENGIVSQRPPAAAAAE